MGQLSMFLVVVIIVYFCILLVAADDNYVRRKANMRWGVHPFRFDFTDDVDVNVRVAFTFLKARGLASDGDKIVLVSDLKPSPGEIVRSIQVRTIK
jgi:pyruvate kinase